LEEEHPGQGAVLLGAAVKQKEQVPLLGRQVAAD